MQGTVLYGTGDIRFEGQPRAKNHQANRCHHPAGGYMRLGIGPVELSR